MGPSVKFVSPNKGLISKKKTGVNFFPGKMTKPGVGSEGGMAKDHTFSHYFLLTPSLINLYDLISKRICVNCH